MARRLAGRQHLCEGRKDDFKRANTMRLVTLGIVFTLAVCGCAATPMVSSWRPWSRVIGDHTGTPQPGDRIRLAVSGTTEPLIGDESLFQSQLKSRLADLLTRRGFVASDSGAGWECSLIYRTSAEVALTLNSTTYSSYRSTSATSASARTSGGYGVDWASALARTTSSAATTSSVTQSRGFVHSIALEMRRDGSPMSWKGEAQWESRRLEITHGLVTALQMLASKLRASADAVPTVDKVKTTHALVYYRLDCERIVFSCPALPSNIWFPPMAGDALPRGISGPDALAAYGDLIATAEYALPKGKGTRLWSRVLLGSRYRLGTDTASTPILIELVGSREGYTVERAWKASSSEFASFEDRLRAWQEQLKSYYDVFE